MAGLSQILEFVLDVDDKASAKFNQIGKSADTHLGNVETKTKGIGGAFENAASKSPLLTGALDKVGLSGQQAGSMISTAMPAAMLAAGGAVAAFGVHAFGTFQDLAGSVLDFQRIVGGSAEESSAFVAVLDDYEISAEAGAAAIGKMAKVVSNTPAVFEKFGVEIAKNADGTTNLQATLLNAAEAYQNTGDDATKAALGAAIFGKGYAEIIPILEKGADGAEGLQEAFAGVEGQQILSQDQIDSAEDTRLAMDRLGDAVNEITIALGSGLSPVVGDVANKIAGLTEAADKLLGPVGGLDSAIGFMVDSALSGGPVLKVLKDGITGLVTSTEEATIGIGFMDSALKSLDDTDQKLTGSTAAVEQALGLETTAHAENEGAALADKIAAEGKSEADKAAKTSADAFTAGLKRQKEAADALYASTNSLISSDLAYRTSVDSTEGAVLDYNIALWAAAAAGYGDAAANEALDDSTRGAEAAIIAEATAAVAAAEDQATLAGFTLSAAEKADIQRGALEDLKNKFPELNSQIQAMIDKLNAIPTRITTFVDTQFTESGHAPGGGRSATSGSGMPILSRPATSGNGSGPTFNITVNAGVGADGNRIGLQAMNAIMAGVKNWERSNGPVLTGQV